MTISSRTPEGWPNSCPLCGNGLFLEPSIPPGDAPCPNCGCLLWFASARDFGTATDFGGIEMGAIDERVLEASQARQSVVIDLREVQMLTTAALRRLFQWNRQLAQSGTRLILCHVNPGVREIFERTRLNALFEIRER